MSAVSEALVREYLEGLGFLVQMPRKYQVIARARRPDEEIDLIGWNPSASGEKPEPGLWTGVELRRVRAVAVAVRGWHTESFSSAMLEATPELFRFVEDESVRPAAERLGTEKMAKILCVPGFSGDARQRDAALAVMRERGVDGVIAFRTILVELAGMAEEHCHYDRSDLLQLLRLLKIYDLMKSPQLELFRPRVKAERMRPRRRKPSRPTEAGPGSSTEGTAPAPAGGGETVE